MTRRTTANAGKLLLYTMNVVVITIATLLVSRVVMAQQISAGFDHAMVVEVGGQAQGWGDPIPGDVSKPQGKVWAQISAGGMGTSTSDHACGITITGEGSCWGRVPIYTTSTSKPMPTGKTWKQISAGGQHR